MFGFIGLGLIMGDFARIDEVLVSRKALMSLIVLGAFVALSLPLYYVALRRMDVWKLRMFMLATPVLTAAVEWPLWGMKMSPLQWLGGAIILGALAVLIRIEWQLSRKNITPDSARMALRSVNGSDRP